MRSLLGFTTATMLFTQLVGSFCLTTTSAFSIRSSSLIFSLRETGTSRGGCTTGEMLESTLLSVHLEGNLGLQIDLSIIHTSFEPFPQDTLRDSVAEVGALGQEDQGLCRFGHQVS